jgi:hypothetical protein
MVNRAIDTLVPIIAKAPVAPSIRQQWLQRLWQALQDDNVPYIEGLGDYWGKLCAGAECACQWADEFRPSVEQVSQASGYAYFKGSSAYFYFVRFIHAPLETVWRVNPWPFGVDSAAC